MVTFISDHCVFDTSVRLLHCNCPYPGRGIGAASYRLNLVGPLKILADRECWAI